MSKVSLRFKPTKVVALGKNGIPGVSSSRITTVVVGSPGPRLLTTNTVGRRRGGEISGTEGKSINRV